MSQDIRDQGLNRLVVVACSPREHEKTFMEVCSQAGLNPYLLQMVNIREQCSWVVADREAATRKAKTLLRAGVRRVALHDPLERQEMTAHSSALVVGAGVAGIEAALVLAQEGREVYVVEKTPCVGGMANRYEDVFPAMECGSCMLEPKLDQLLHQDNIHVFTCAEIEEVVGFFGNYTVRIRKKARSVDPSACYGCDDCMKACPVQDIPNEFNQGLDARAAIYVPYPGSLPNAAVVDRSRCLHFHGSDCTACAQACPFGAIDLDAVDEVIEVEVGGVVLAPGFTQFDCARIPSLGYGRVPEVYTSLEFESLLASGGPTGGEIRMRSGEAPSSIAFLHCIGSRSEDYNAYCSGTCCLYTMKFAHLAHKKLPDAQIYDVHADHSVAGKGYFELFRTLQKDRIRSVRTEDPNRILVEHRGGPCLLTLPDTGADPIEADMVVLSPAMEPAADTREIAKLFGVPVDSLGFFREEHGRLGAVNTNIEGVYITGCAQGPKDIQSSVIQGAAAAGKILSSLVRGEMIQLETLTAWADEERCAGCKVCISVCPYKAITYDLEERLVSVNEALCRGCGTCAAACGSGAMTSRHFTRGQIFAELEGAFRDG
ncbi:MAG: CoB--CoM heterodisulfide reductase iron-sulfur subunit A family protein [Pseudomonadota bacterium]